MRQKLTKALNDLASINEKYDLSTKKIEERVEEIKKAKVCVPVIGPFSSGKSALLNALLGGGKRRYLREKITAETPVPTELVYSDERCVFDTAKIIYNNGRNEVIPMSEFIKREPEGFLDAAAYVRLRLKNDFLNGVPDVMPVDMPGFGSGRDVHNKAIDGYKDRSMIYLVVFPADDMNLRADIVNMLKELCLVHGIPFSVAITKLDEAPPEAQFNASLDKLKDDLKKYMRQEFKVYKTSRDYGEVREALTFFEEVQEKSGGLLLKRYLPSVKEEADLTRVYLNGFIKSGGLSESDLSEKEDRIKADLDDLEKRAREISADFKKQTETGIEEIKADVLAALEAQKGALTAMIMSGSGESAISERLNVTLRYALAESMKKRYSVKMEKYVERLNAAVNMSSVLTGTETADADAAGGDAFVEGAAGAIGGGAIGGLAGVGASIAAPAVVAALPAISAIPAITLGSLVIPGVGILLAGIGAAIGLIASVFGKGEKEGNKEQEIRRNLSSQVFPDVMRQVGEKIEQALTENTEQLENEVSAQIAAKRSACEKALADNRASQKQANEEKEAKLNEAADDLKYIEELLFSLGDTFNAA
jgi:GTPase SAR1 family protein